MNESDARDPKSTIPAPPPTTDEPSADRALEALDACVRVAEKGGYTPPPTATVGDWSTIEIPKLRRGFERVILARHPEEGLDALLAAGALDALLPEVKAMVGFGDGEWRHKDVWKHTKQVVRQSVPRVEVRWAALLHDIGKVKTRRILPNGEVHFHGHAEVGASMFDRLQSRTRLFVGEDTLAERVRELILHHLRASQYDGTWTDSAVRRFAKEMGDCLIDLFDLSRADITTKRPERKRKGLESISELAERVRRVREMDARIPPLPKGLGTAISERFGVAPSPRLGEVMKALKDKVDGGELEAQREVDYYLQFIGDAKMLSSGDG
ncbi:MAG: HD domain-containing protein [Myxococcales bacterium]|nr:HD domain-containing protein [Myxococcales bacterium]